jgi:hypothetical protein
MKTYEQAKEETKQLTKAEAIELANTHPRASAEWFKFQILQTKLCSDFSTFHESAEIALGRGVWTHEFSKPELLWAELQNIKE